MARKSALALLALTAALLLEHCQTDEKVSFYGASYIHLSVQEAKSATDISFRFRTHLADAMLLLAAGRTDYCLIKLESGTLKVHINLGAGEKVLESARELTLNDLSWHEVNLTRRDANITLKIDVIHSVSDVLPGRFFELNINFGVYIGGQGSFNELFLGHTEYLRGCMANIMYNGLTVIEHARRRNSTEATAVSWGCSAEFDASPRAEISFVEDGAFTAIPRAIPRSGSSWELELKTVSPVGLLLFNAGQSSHADFLGVELVDGKIRLLMNKGNGPTELIHNRPVADGLWHEVQLNFTPSFVGISVDGQMRNLSLPSGNRYLDLADTLYIGGTELNKRAKALSKGIKSGDVSYKGCLKNMMLDGKELGLPNVKVSQGLVVNCVWGFPCAEAVPCVPGAICSQLGVGSFKCTCDQTLCIKSNFTEEYKFDTNLPISLEVLAVRPLEVAEGRRAVITERNIALVLDVAKYGLNESHLVFALLTPPVHGSLQLERLNLAPKTPFTLYDVHQMKISYLHDGSETTEDSMILKVALQASSRHALPGYFQDSLRFTLHISVTPVNDPPRLEVAFNATLKLAQGTRKTLTRDIIWAVDADTPAESLVYSVLPNDNDVGHVERTTVSGGGGGEPQQQLVHTFTQAELAHGSIDYVHSGKNKTKAVLALKVSDGEASSMPAFLHIETYPLSIELKQNTGLVVVHRSFSYLTPANLSFTTNAKDSRIEIRYNIVKPPQYGILQRQKDYMLPWTNTDHFTSRDLEQQAVRYLHNVGSPFQDNFKFKARVREVQSPMTYDFNVTFIILELVEVHRSIIDFTNSARVVIDSRKIKFQTNPLLTESNLIIYSLLESPRYGHVYLEEEKLRIGQMFSQHDIDLGRLHYRHFRRAFSLVEDSILFKVTAPQCSDVTTSLSFRYQPAKSANLPQSVESIRVVEGERALVKLTRINYHDFDVSALGFNVTDLPRHGCLTIYNKSVPLRVNTTYFTSEELASHLVYYVHDDSETFDDTFQFLAMSTDDADFMYIGVFHISIELRNDNPPKRINSHIFHVVSGGEKPITRADLLYADEDQHTKPSDIVYTVKQLNGMLFRVDDPLYQVNQFTQQDIDEERIVYKHRGNKYERIDFTVSDGELVTNGELEIQAGQAYVKLLLHDGCIVQSNRSVALSPHDIDIETNVNANPSEVIFSVMEGPKYGIILKHGRVVSSFDRNDLQRKAVSYKHVGSTLKKDQFRLKVNAKGAEDSDALTIKVLPENYWQPLIVRTNNTVYVEEATSVIMNRKSLDIGYPGIPENRIVYHIKQWPRNGYLEVQSHEEILETEGDDDFSTHLVKHFEQSLVNEGRVYYVQSTPNQTHDRFIVDVTNGITWLRNLSINIVIMPDKLYMDSRNLTVDEGKSVIFQDSNFYAVTSYFAGKITDYRVIEKPKHGTIVDIRNNPIRNFTHKQLASQKVLYKNNGDEVTEDYFKMVVVAGEKSSEPFKVWINVRPINDEVPALVNKTHFNIWQGGSVLITRDLLAAIDNDTQPVDLVFNIKNVANGYFSLVELPKIGIHNFSQEMINTFKVLFTHTNGSEAEFRFTVSDGLHTTEAFWVSLDTKPIQIMMERNRMLKVFPLARKPITSDLLLAKCSDPDRDVEYIVTNAPSMGKIIMESSEGNWLEVDRFTQKDLNNSKVSYEHNRQFNNLSASDSFNFDVKTHFAAPIKNEIFKIDISVSSGGLHRFVSVTPVRVEEGGSSPFSLNVSGIIHFLRTKAAIFKPEVSARLIRKPEHGHVMLLPDVNVTTYSQGEIESGQIAYFHDHSDTLKDEIDFTLYFSPGHIALCNVSVPVDIVPINDQPFKLEVTKDIDIVQNQTQTITRDNLLTTDPDTGPENIIYEIITAPTYGRLILLSGDRIIGSDLQSTKKFTQLDIDSSRLVYEHQGPLLVSTFYFRVSDGYFQHEYKFFKINVHPIKLNMTILKPVEIQQGQSWTSVDTDSLHLETNVRHELVTYEVTRPPEHGRLHAREQTSRFRHTDLLSKSVIYEQQDMSVSADSFELTAKVSEFELRNIHIPIRAVPLMILGTGMEVFAGDRTKLTIKHFDATPLAKLAKINPTIRITRKPKYAKVMRIMNRTMSSGEKRGVQEKETNTFSHSHVLSGVIYLVCKKVPSDDILGVQDNFGFTLTAEQNPPRFQPAASTFNFRVRLGSDYYNNSLDGPMDPVGHEGEMAIAPNMSNDYTLLLGMLLGVFFLGICVIVTIRCRQSRFKDPDDEDDEEDDGHEDKVEPSSPSVMPLPRPPDHLLPATPHLKRYTANDHHNNSLISSTPLPPMMPSLTSTLPQCKVIPLSPMENTAGSEIDVSVRYPYGVADGDEWSSFDTTELPCPSQTSQPRSTTNASNNPLLRRNQYWV